MNVTYSNTKKSEQLTFRSMTSVINQQLAMSTSVIHPPAWLLPKVLKVASVNCIHLKKKISATAYKTESTDLTFRRV